MTKTRAYHRTVPQYDPPARFISALAAGAIVEMFDGPLDEPRLAFRMKSGGAAIHVVTLEGEIVGVFATALAAAKYGFLRLDREAKERRAAPGSKARVERRGRGKVGVDG